LLLLGFQLISGRAARRARPVNGQVFGSNLLISDVRSRDRNLALNLLLLRLVEGRFGGVEQHEFSVALGAEAHGGRASEEAAVVGTANEPFRDLAPGLLLFSVPALLGHYIQDLSSSNPRKQRPQKKGQKNPKPKKISETKAGSTCLIDKKFRDTPGEPKRPWKD